MDKYILKKLSNGDETDLNNEIGDTKFIMQDLHTFLEQDYWNFRIF